VWDVGQLYQLFAQLFFNVVQRLFQLFGQCFHLGGFFSHLFGLFPFSFLEQAADLFGQEIGFRQMVVKVLLGRPPVVVQFNDLFDDHGGVEIFYF